MDLLPTSSDDSASSPDTGSGDVPYSSEPTPRNQAFSRLCEEFSPNPPAQLPSLPVVGRRSLTGIDDSLFQPHTNPSTRPQPVSTYPHVVTEEQHTQMLYGSMSSRKHIVFNIDLEGNSLDGGEPTKPRASQQFTNRNYDNR
ncbi:hypothetical protein IV203_013725 [Nitzschia inconspicua]|uniref:Uncharacterized protein n=1 Tax=Nitzschia inconspicua TaxID=303405 RepID=A0A9K3M6C7_9STRA|nr:hypothetical protein IV203_013725 [Nitzschia inconspicua]